MPNPYSGGSAAARGFFGAMGNMALEQFKAEIQAERDAALAGQQMERQQQDQEFRATEAGKDRGARRTESRADRAARDRNSRLDRGSREELQNTDARQQINQKVMELVDEAREVNGDSGLEQSVKEQRIESIKQEIMMLMGRPETAADREYASGRGQYYRSGGSRSGSSSGRRLDDEYMGPEEIEAEATRLTKEALSNMSGSKRRAANFDEVRKKFLYDLWQRNDPDNMPTEVKKYGESRSDDPLGLGGDDPLGLGVR